MAGYLFQLHEGEFHAATFMDFILVSAERKGWGETLQDLAK